MQDERFQTIQNIFDNFCLDNIDKALVKCPFSLALFLIIKQLETGKMGYYQADNLYETAKQRVLRMVEAFDTLNNYLADDNRLCNLYLNDKDARRGFLTNGILIGYNPGGGESKSNKNEEQLKYFLPQDIKSLTIKEFHDLRRSIHQYLYEPHEPKVDSGNGFQFQKWEFWAGCYMIIPEIVEIFLDPYSDKFKIMMTPNPLKVEPTEFKLESSVDSGKPFIQDSDQVMITEVPRGVRFCILGKPDIELDQGEVEKGKIILKGPRKLKNGFYTIETSGLANPNTAFSKLVLDLKEAQKYQFQLWLPYPSPRFEVLGITKLRFEESKDGELNTSKSEIVISTAT